MGESIAHRPKEVRKRAILNDCHKEPLKLVRTIDQKNLLVLRPSNNDLDYRATLQIPMLLGNVEAMKMLGWCIR